MKIKYKRKALRDIEEKRNYIAETLKNRTAAQKLAASILRAVSLLADNPKMGTPLNSKFEVDTDLRFLIVAKQLVFYRIVRNEYISILRVIDGRQDYMAVLFDE